MFQLTQAQTGKFNVHVHVEYEWRLQNEDLDESDEEMEDKVNWCIFCYCKPHVEVFWVCNSPVSTCSPAAYTCPPRGASGQLLHARQRPHAAQPGNGGPRCCQPGARQTEVAGHQHDDKQRDVRHHVGPQPAATGTNTPASPQSSQQRSENGCFGEWVQFVSQILSCLSRG